MFQGLARKWGKEENGGGGDTGVDLVWIGVPAAAGADEAEGDDRRRELHIVGHRADTRGDEIGHADGADLVVEVERDRAAAAAARRDRLQHNAGYT